MVPVLQHIIEKPVEVLHPEHVGWMTECIYQKCTCDVARIIPGYLLQFAGTNNNSEIMMFSITYIVS